MTKKAMADWLANGDYAVRTGETDRDYAVRQYLRIFSAAELAEMVDLRQRRLNLYPIRTSGHPRKV